MPLKGQPALQHTSLRVLMFVPHYPYPVAGGLERQAHELAKALGRAGVRVSALAARFASGHPFAEEVEGVPVARVYVSPVRAARFLAAASQLAQWLWTKRRSFDVVHVHQHSWAGLFVIAFAALLGVPVIAKLPTFGDCGIAGMRKMRLGWLRVFLLRRADALIAMSETVAEELRAVGHPLTRTLYVPNGIPLMAHDKRKRTNEALRRGYCRVVFVGRLSEEKCIEHLLLAWRRLMCSSGAPARLELWGDGPQRPELEAMVAAMGLTASVRFLGHRTGVRELLREADVFVLTSRVEGNSNAVLEAMEAGLPIVATSVGGTPMQVGEGGAALLVEPGDIEGIASRLGALIESQELRHQYGQSMRRRVVEHFSMEGIAEAYLRAYSALLASEETDLSKIGGLPK